MKSNKKKSNEESLDKKNLEPCTMELKISEDGRAIIDENGTEIARFREGLVVRLPKGRRIAGHMECHPECIRWNNQGKCVYYVQECTWVFDPLA